MPTMSDEAVVDVLNWSFFAPSKFDAALVNSLPFVSAVLSCLLLASHCRRWFRTWTLLRSLPGPPTDWFPPWFMIASYWHFRKQLPGRATSVVYKVISKLSRKYRGKTYKGYIGFSPVVMLHTPEAVEVLLSTKENTGKPNMYGFMKSWLGPKNILTSRGDPWKEKARMVKAGFSSEHLERCMEVFNKNGDILAKRIESMTAESPDEPITCYYTIQKCILDVIGRAAMGIQLGLQNGEREEYAVWFDRLTRLVTVRYFRPWLWIKAIYYMTKEGKVWKATIRNIGELHLSVIEKRKAALARKASYSDDTGYEDDVDGDQPFRTTLDVFLDKHLSKPSYTLKEFEKDVTTIMFAAADSTAAALSWTLYLLGLNHDKQAKLHKELDDAFGRGVEREFNMSDLKQLPYLECCIKESFRLCPPFPLIGRQLDEDLVFDGHTVPAGTTCMIDIISLHRDPAHFTNPDDYIPERFLPENTRNMHPFSFIPFSAGVRVCLGQRFVMPEIKILLAKLLCKYTVEATVPLEEVDPAYEVVLKARGGLRVWFRKRAESP